MLPTGGALANACGPGPVGQLIYSLAHTSDFAFGAKIVKEPGSGVGQMCDARTTRRDQDISP